MRKRKAHFFTAMWIVGIMVGSGQAAFPVDKYQVTATANDVQQFFGTTNVKLVFVADSANNGQSREVYLLDYTNLSGVTTPTIQKTGAPKGAVHPIISPDGTMLAHAMGVANDGTSQNISSAWVYKFGDASGRKIADTAFVPRWVQNATKPTLVYGTALPAGKGDTLEKIGRTMRREFEGNTIGIPIPVFAGGSYVGGLSYDNNYLATAWLAGTSARMVDVRTGTRTIVHSIKVKSQSGRDSVINTITCCNPSISSSRIFTNTMMYFDFGSGLLANGKYTNQFLGTWGLHTRIFIGRADGNILKFYDLPRQQFPTPTVWAGEVQTIEWDNPEWSNHPYFSTAIIMPTRVWDDGAGKSPRFPRFPRHEQIVAIDLRDSKHLKIVQVLDTSRGYQWKMLWPSLYVAVDPSFEEDSRWLADPIDVSIRRARNPGSNVSGIQFDGVKITSTSEIAEISVHNAAGAVISSKKISPRTATLLLSSTVPDVSRGIYFVRVKTNSSDVSHFRWVKGQ